MKIAVVDDLAKERNEIISLVTDYFSVRFLQYNITPEFEEFESGEVFLNNFSCDKYDLVLLDIYMDKLTGIEVAEKLADIDKKCKIIFFTTSTDHILYGYSVHALGYILKPVNIHRQSLYTALDYYIDLLNLDKAALTIYTTTTEQFALFKNIIYLECSLRNLFFHFSTSVVQASGRYTEYAKIILEDERFLECFRNIIVNMDYIIKPVENDFILKTGGKIPISRRRKSEVLEKYTNYFINRRGY